MFISVKMAFVKPLKSHGRKKIVIKIEIPEGNFVGNDDIDTYLLSFLHGKDLLIFSQVIKKLQYLCKNIKALVDRVEQLRFNKIVNIKRMIGYAIISEKSKIGSTRPYIKKYLETNYKVEPDDPRINNVIRLLLLDESLVRNKKKGGHFHLSPKYKKWINNKEFNVYCKTYNISDDAYWNYIEPRKVIHYDEYISSSEEIYDNSGDDYIPPKIK